MPSPDDTNARYEIPFTQYLLPDGRKRSMSFAVKGESARKAMQIVDAGLLFEAEILTTGEVSLTVHDPDLEEDIAIVVVPNGPGMTDAVESLIEQATTQERN